MNKNKLNDKILRLEDELFLEFVKFNNNKALEKLSLISNSWFLYKINSMVRDPEIAKDLSQDIWISAISKKFEFDPNQGHFRTWMYNKIAIGKILHYLRDNKNSIINDKDKSKIEENIITTDNNPEEELIHNETSTILKKAIFNLKNYYRDTIILNYYGKFKLTYIANILDVDSDRVNNWHSRAKKKLASSLKNK